MKEEESSPHANVGDLSRPEATPIQARKSASPPIPPDAPDDPTPGQENQEALPVATASASSNASPNSEPDYLSEPGLPLVLRQTDLEKVYLAVNQSGTPIAVLPGSRNKAGIPIKSKHFHDLIKATLYKHRIFLSSSEYKELFAQLEATATYNGNKIESWTRNAPLKNSIGVEIDLGTHDNCRVVITPGNVDIVTTSSDTVFTRPPAMMPLPVPNRVGDIEPLKKLLNFPEAEFKILLGWMTYTIAHPKITETNYPILAIKGGQGSGKSLSVKFIADLVDPSQIGSQVFPNNVKDLAILSQNVHVLVIDNTRSFSPQMADYLCVLCSGGKIGARALYTDSDVHIFHLHCAVILNGIHDFITQSDLAQRTLQISTVEIPRGDRVPEKELRRKFEEQKSTIFSGLLDLISKIFLHLDDVEITHPERMIEFTYWLAAMEKVDGVHPGTYQGFYSHLLEQAELDTLHGDPVASAVLEFSTKTQGSNWEGTPAQLLEALTKSIPESARRSYEWPKTASALSKRLRSLQSSLQSQGVAVNFTRGKLRQVCVSRFQEVNDA